MYPHRIRLRGPWECVPVLRMTRLPDGKVESDPGILPGPVRVTVPGHWQTGGLAGFTGRVRYRRPFGYPGRIDDNERVWITLEKVHGSSEISLNSRLLATEGHSFDYKEFEVTSLLQVRNELIVEVEDLEGTGGLIGEVAMEVRRLAFLRSVNVALESPGCLCVSGEVVGPQEGPLEIYVVWGRRNVGYSLVHASEEGTNFRIKAVIPPLNKDSSEANDPVPDSVRVELIQGAIVWYSVDRKIPDQGVCGRET
jgi:hypothetical protein